MPTRTIPPTAGQAVHFVHRGEQLPHRQPRQFVIDGRDPQWSGLPAQLGDVFAPSPPRPVPWIEHLEPEEPEAEPEVLQVANVKIAGTGRTLYELKLLATIIRQIQGEEMGVRWLDLFLEDSGDWHEQSQRVRAMQRAFNERNQTFDRKELGYRGSAGDE